MLGMWRCSNQVSDLMAAFSKQSKLTLFSLYVAVAEDIPKIKTKKIAFRGARVLEYVFNQDYAW